MVLGNKFKDFWLEVLVEEDMMRWELRRWSWATWMVNLREATGNWGSQCARQERCFKLLSLATSFSRLVQCRPENVKGERNLSSVEGKLNSKWMPRQIESWEFPSSTLYLLNLVLWGRPQESALIYMGDCFTLYCLRTTALSLFKLTLSHLYHLLQYDF